MTIIQTNCTHLDASHFEYSPTIDSFEYEPEKVFSNFTSQEVTLQPKIARQYQAATAFHPHHIPTSKLIPKNIKPTIMSLMAQKLQTGQTPNNINTYPQRSLNQLSQQALSQKKQLQSLDEYHIDTDFLTDKHLEKIIQKMDQETTAFLSKLSTFIQNVSTKYDDFTNNKTSSMQTLSTYPDLNVPVTISREQAIIQLKDINEKLFDHNDNKPLSIYISAMKAIIPYLDALEDATIIESINFLDKNQHRTTLWDLVFWIQYAQTIKVDTIHPTIKNSEVNQIPITTRIQTLIKKSELKTETKK